jgi:hypothetical protein
MKNNYMSELESEFELNNELSSNNEYNDESNFEEEYNYELESDDAEYMDQEDDEFEDNEYEEDEYEDDEFENEYENDEEYETDYATNSRDGNYDRDREFENRLYQAIRTNVNSELDTDHELESILHEMEQEYFFGSAKRWLKNKANRLKSLKGLTALGRLNIRKLLKSKLLQTAAAFIPGAGPIVSKVMGIASSALDKVDAAKEKIQDVVQVGKEAYKDLAKTVPEAQNEFEVQRASKMALNRAIQNQSLRKFSGGRFGKNSQYNNRVKRVLSIQLNARVAVFPTKISINRSQKIVALKANSIVVVIPGKIIIWETK